MIKSKSDLNYYLQEDRKVNLWDPDMSAIALLAKLFYKSSDAIAYDYLKKLRYLEYALNCRKKGPVGHLYYWWRRMLWSRAGFRYNISIGPNEIGYGFRILHAGVGGGMIINCKSMGNYCIANQGLVIGNKNGDDENRATIGDYVEFTPGVKVVGKLTIGNNVKVAPNSVVIKSIPDNCVVSGVPAMVIKKDGEKV